MEKVFIASKTEMWHTFCPITFMCGIEEQDPRKGNVEVGPDSRDHFELAHVQEDEGDLSKALQ